MTKISYLNETYECDVALLGPDYVHLLDANGQMIAAFDGITNLYVFKLLEGYWTTPSSENDCFVAVMREDGTLGKGGHKCCDVITKNGDQTINGTLTATKIIGAVYA